VPPAPGLDVHSVRHGDPAGRARRDLCARGRVRGGAIGSLACEVRADSLNEGRWGGTFAQGAAPSGGRTGEGWDRWRARGGQGAAAVAAARPASRRATGMRKGEHDT
jgi:hypothetical protein